MNIAMTFSILLPLATVWLLAVMSPGPNFIVVLQTAVVAGRLPALMAALGTVTGTFIWAVTGLFGLKALFAAVPLAGDIVRVAGALYLISIAVRAWLAGNKPMVMPEGRVALSLGRAYLRGLATNLSNPKTAAFAASLFAVAVPADAPFAVYVAALVTIVAISAAWYVLFCLLASTGLVRAQFVKLHKPLHRLMAVAFASFGLRLIFSRG